jgi:hypothetical protein
MAEPAFALAGADTPNWETLPTVMLKALLGADGVLSPSVVSVAVSV